MLLLIIIIIVVCLSSATFIRAAAKMLNPLQRFCLHFTFRRIIHDLRTVASVVQHYFTLLTQQLPHSQLYVLPVDVGGKSGAKTSCVGQDKLIDFCRLLLGIMSCVGRIEIIMW